MRVLFICALVLLAGCKTAEERARQHASNAHQECLSYGLQPGSTGYANCRLQLRQMYETRRAREQQENLQMMQQGIQMMQPPPTCYTTRTLTGYSTQCY